jgi:hypothetical protein
LEIFFLLVCNALREYIIWLYCFNSIMIWANILYDYVLCKIFQGLYDSKFSLSWMLYVNLRMSILLLLEKADYRCQLNSVDWRWYWVQLFLHLFANWWICSFPLHFCFVLFFVLFCSAGDEPQVFMHDRKILYHWICPLLKGELCSLQV